MFYYIRTIRKMEVVQVSLASREALLARLLPVAPIPPQSVSSSGLASGVPPLQSMQSIPISAPLE